MLLHVSTAGDDSNTGFSPGEALRTLNEFYRRVRSDYDIAGHTLFAQVADGEYEENEITCIAATIGATQVIVQGKRDDPDAVKIRCRGGAKLFFTRDFGMTTLRDLTLGTTGKRSRLVNVTSFSTIDLDRVSFEAAPEGVHISVCQGFLVVQNDYRILGGAARHLSAADNGVLYYGGFTVEIPEPVSFDDFVVAESGALVSAGGAPMKFAGKGLAHCAGRKFHILSNAVLLSNGANFPGDKPGIGPETAREAIIALEKKLIAEKDLLLAQKDALLDRQQELLAERDAMLTEQRQLLTQRDAMLTEQRQLLAQRDATLAEQKAMLSESESRLAAQGHLLSQRDATLAEQKLQLAESDGVVAEQRQLLAQRDALLAGQKDLIAERDETLRLRARQLAEHEAMVRAMQASRSWRITAPLRSVRRWLLR
jgi:hypothetical protein